MKITHPRHWRLLRIQGRFNWIFSVTEERGYLRWNRIGWR